jgi:LysM repeat protein
MDRNPSPGEYGVLKVDLSTPPPTPPHAWGGESSCACRWTLRKPCPGELSAILPTQEIYQALRALTRYNCPVKRKISIGRMLFLILLLGMLHPGAGVMASPPQAKPAQSGEPSAYELIIAMNTLRMSFGLPALVEDPIINAVAQATAEIMAANQSSWHIGDVSGRIASAGYGGGAKVWATENFAVGGNHTIDEIMVVWADESHMIPAVNPAYCHVGAGTAKSSNGMTYYVLQAAYIAGKSCGDYVPPSGNSAQPGLPRQPGVSQLIVPVKIAEPDEEGKIFHKVEMGQSFWAIAVAYQITIRDIEIWNNISRESKLQPGQSLFIPSSNTEGYATPTPVGMILVSTPDADGVIMHSVQSYQTLYTISQAYGTGIDRILALNGIQEDWPLQIGQNLLIHPGNVTPTPTPRPLTPIEKLTPASDGKYYHTVHSGETLSWIADLYEVNMFDLMSWNGLNAASIIQPDQKLVLQVTPPATVTPTPGPATHTPTPTQSPTPTATHARPRRLPARSPAQKPPLKVKGTWGSGS